MTIVDYGMGNLASVKNMVYKVGGRAQISANIESVSKAKKIILPGVGSFDQGIKQLKTSGLYDVIRDLGEQEVPILGICLGMQLLARGSEEGVEKGLSLIDAEFRRFNFKNGIKLPIPHVGWNEVSVLRNNILIPQCDPTQRYYFTHTYHAACDNDKDIIATAHYGYSFPAAYNQGNIYGVQFHPEKSHRFGMELMNHFVGI